MSNEAKSRKARSIAMLKAEGIPYTDDLPMIETVAEARMRSLEEVALRAIALCIVAAKGEGIEEGTIKEAIKRYGIEESFTPDERKFLSNRRPKKHDGIQFSWRYECYWVLLWALGFIEALGRPESMCDVPAAITILRQHGRDGFLKYARLRPTREILDAADLIYRYAWAADEARIHGLETPGGLDPGVVHERHHALNWLIGSRNEEWDDVMTDT